MQDPSWYSILPPVLAIVLAIWSKQVILSLFAGIWMGFTILNGFNPLVGVTAGLDGVINVFGDAGDTKVLIFTLLIGSLIATIEYSGGVRGFVHFLESRRWVHTGVRAQLLAWVTGLVIFIESNITLLVAGSVSRPLFDRYRVSREKLAYLIDATSAPVCVMIPLNAWGAVIIGLVAGAGVENPLEAFIASIPYNLYAITAIFLALIVIWKDLNIGPMRAAEERTKGGDLLWPGATPLVDTSAEETPEGERPEDIPSAWYMGLPIITMILMMPVGLYATGDGNIIEGSGSTAILWSVGAAILVAWIMLLVRGGTSVNQLMAVFMKGAGNLLPISTILLLALALGDVAGLLGTGSYVAGVAGAAVPEIDDTGPADAVAARRRYLRRDLRRSCLADQRHHRRRLDGVRHRPHRSRAHTASLRPGRCKRCNARVSRFEHRIGVRRDGASLQIAAETKSHRAGHDCMIVSGNRDLDVAPRQRHGDPF